MLKLILIRHSKSSWTETVHDLHRDITDLGCKNIRWIADAIKSQLPADYTIWSSIAKRTKHTARIFCDQINNSESPIILKEELYTFDAVDLEYAIKGCSDNIQTLIIFGHNPALTDFASKFGSVYLDKIPTSGVVIIQFDEDHWRDIKSGLTILELFPKKKKD